MPTKHGVYTTQAATGVSTPSVADSGIPFVVGAAPVQSADNYSAAALGLPVLCTSFAEAKAALGYSDDFASYDLCEVMYTHFQLFGCQPVILCNMLNPATMKATVTAADINLTDHKALLPIDAINDASLVVKPSTSGSALTKGTDYEAYYSGENLVVEAIEGGSAYSAAKLNIAYNKVDISKVTKTVVAGGFAAVDSCMSTVGIVPDLLLAPKYSSESEVAAVMATKAGGINGKQIELIVEDDAGDPRTASLAAQKLASAGVMAVIGTYGSAVTEASQNIIDEAEIMQIATGSTSVRLTEKGLPLFFRTCPRDDEQGRVASKVIAAKGFKKVAILHDNSSYAKGLAEEAQKGLKDAGVPVVFYDALTPSERDYTAILTKLKAADPDLIFFTGYYPEAGMLLRQKKEMHWDVPMMGGDAANNTDLVKIAGKDAAKGYFFISPPSAHDFDTPEAKDFFSRYKAQYNSLPSSVWSVLAGDAFKVIVAALQAGTDANPEAVAKYLKKDLKEYPGLTGKLGFNEKGDRIGDLYKVYEVDGNGGFVLQK